MPFVCLLDDFRQIFTSLVPKFPRRPYRDSSSVHDIFHDAERFDGQRAILTPACHFVEKCPLATTRSYIAFDFDMPRRYWRTMMQSRQRTIWLPYRTILIICAACVIAPLNARSLQMCDAQHCTGMIIAHALPHGRHFIFHAAGRTAFAI